MITFLYFLKTEVCFYYNRILFSIYNHIGDKYYMRNYKISAVYYYDKADKKLESMQKALDSFANKLEES